ncbi:MAG: type II toxin-antitoxin system RelE/ParE family toxin [Flavobacteriales bacterium]|nr:type II toxin-antitoxin system RelE/ParE family toxin [Flavobacteriales bacterium]MBP9079545.1 type II toxin-antitoxin system RelE/ParE family toxin [Flavobacteriales bacterium]
MAVRLVYRDEALEDIADAMRWYAARSEGLGERFLKAVLEREALISKYPKGAPVVHKHFRQTPINSFPFLMVYGLVKNELIIYRIFHTKQHPRKKFKRRT